MDGKLFNVGKIVNTHGIRGEVKIVPQTDFADVRFGKGSRLTLVHPDTQAVMEATVETGRPQKNVYIVRFADFNDISQAEKLKGWMVKVGEKDLVELEEGEYYLHEIVGCRVLTDEGEELGTISEVLSPGANDVWVVARPTGKDLLLPVIDDVILDVDVTNKTVTVHVLEGLL